MFTVKSKNRVRHKRTADTIPEAISPGFTLLDALLNSSEFFGEKAVYRAWIMVRSNMKALKNSPIPVDHPLQ